jgi:hypothetical protein
MRTKNRWRGVAKLVTDAVEEGSKAVERIQKETARRPFAILEMIPAIAVPALAAHVIHDATVSGVHGAIRLVTRAVDGTVGVAFDVAELAKASGEDEQRPRALGDSLEPRGRGEPDGRG